MKHREYVDMPTKVNVGLLELTKPELALLSNQYSLRKETHRLMRKITYSENSNEQLFSYEILLKESDDKTSTPQSNSISLYGGNGTTKLDVKADNRAKRTSASKIAKKHRKKASTHRKSISGSQSQGALSSHNEYDQVTNKDKQTRK